MRLAGTNARSREDCRIVRDSGVSEVRSQILHSSGETRRWWGGWEMSDERVTPMSFDLDGSALRPDYVAKVSYGNDSIALIQWLHEYDLKHPLGKVVCLYNDTGWATSWWPARVENAEANLVRKYGFIPARTQSIGMRELLRRHNCWPSRVMPFCTEELKIEPTLSWLRFNDPGGVAEMVCGVRREESSTRRNWPEHEATSDKNEGRAEWSPLALVDEIERDALIVRAGFVPLEHRSRECRCVNAGSQDILKFSEADLDDISTTEKAMTCWGDNRFMFSPRKKKGRPEGIRAVVQWAKQVKPREAAIEPGGGCDAGYCTG